MEDATFDPRELFSKLRAIMAEPSDAQIRLDQIVSVIAAGVSAEVCSLYVVRSGKILELFATKGLNISAVHKTRLKTGEGLVGLIAAEAKVLNLANARSHEAFAYRPETDEDQYMSFLGVPLLRSGHTLGVLVIQNRVQKEYSEEIVETLQTMAMLIAEIFASGELKDLAFEDEDDIAHKRSHHIKAIPLAQGIALGHVVLHEPKIHVINLICEDISLERKRLREALRKLRDSVDNMLSHEDLSRGGEHIEVLKAYQMFAYDRGWANRIFEAVSTGITAEAAVERIQNDNRARMLRQKDPYLRERLHDLDDLSNRLLRILTNKTTNASHQELPKDSIIVAKNMGPAELLDYDKSRIRGLILEEGSANSHVTIVAKALGITMVAQAKDIIDLVDAEDPIIVDGISGAVHLRPPADVEQAYASKVKFRAKKQAQYSKIKNKPAITLDGHRIKLNMNAGLLVDLPHLEESGADGIGLFRTELQFMISSRFPRVEEQMKNYKAIIDAAGETPVTFRTLDIGADKVLPYLTQAREENPALGWRAIRMALDRPALIRLQLRALLRAAAEKELRIMFPMVTDVPEISKAKTLVAKEKNYLKQHNYKLPNKVTIGSMLEVPALAWQLPALAKEVEFISIGSNDLLQFFFATDRNNPRVANRFDPLSPPVLKMLKQVIIVADKYKTPVTLCGEMAGNPIEAMALIGLGFKSISMNSHAIGKIKSMIFEVEKKKLSELVNNIIDNDIYNARNRIEAFAKNNNIPV